MVHPATPVQYLTALAVFWALVGATVFAASKERRQVTPECSTYRYSRALAYFLVLLALGVALLPWLLQRSREDILIVLVLCFVPTLLMFTLLMTYKVVVDREAVSTHSLLGVKRVFFRDLPLVELYGKGNMQTLTITSKGAQLVLFAGLTDFRRLVEEIREHVPAASFSRYDPLSGTFR